MSKEIDQLLTLVKNGGYRHLVFDLDRTITKLELPWAEWIKQMTDALPREKAHELTRLLSIPGGAWGAVINEQIVEDQKFYKQYLKICADFEAKYFSHTPHIELVNALPKLKSLGAALYLWTSNTRPTAERALLELGVLPLFTALVTREDTLLGKPDAEGWEQLKGSDQPPETYLFVGDSQNDELAAKEGGVRYYDISFFK